MFCQTCNFTTNRKSHYERHLQSIQHNKYVFLMSEDVIDASKSPDFNDDKKNETTVGQVESDSHSGKKTINLLENNLEYDTTCIQEDEEIEQHLLNDTSAESTTTTEWYPFSSKSEYLLYVFMNSTTHPVSDEVVKFVLFMMRELGVSNVPALKTFKKKKFGTYSWENLITKGASKENSPVFIIKPSEILKLAIANPEISKRLIRSPDCSDVISHPSNAEKWKKDIDFISETHDKPVVTMPINLFLDDTSTHKSRRWMAFHCIQMQLSGLPLDIRHQQGNIQFLGASEKVDIMDVAKVVVKDIKDLQLNGIESYDVAYNRPCIVKSCIDNIVADFNILSLCCNHLGAAAI